MAVTAPPLRDSPLVAVLGGAANRSNCELVAAWRERGLDARLVAPADAPGLLGPGDVALARIDILPTLDGVEAGLLVLPALAAAGVRVLNSPRALVAAHDKLLTARALARAGLPHPATVHVRARPPAAPVLPVVVKPRFGSWGREVARCETQAELERCVRGVRDRTWFRRHGAIVQELVPSKGRDLRLLVAGGRVVGAVERVAAPGEWRTNVSLGGSRRSVIPSTEEAAVAVAAAAAIGSDFVGVDLLPLEGGDHVVIELNGAVDFSPVYGFGDADVYEELAAALELPGAGARAWSPSNPSSAVRARPAT